jgi:Zn-dependent protease with chaperone function
MSLGTAKRISERAASIKKRTPRGVRFFSLTRRYFLAAFLAAGFLAAGFLAAAFLGAAFLGAAFAVFLAAGFFAATFLGAAFLLAALAVFTTFLVAAMFVSFLWLARCLSLRLCALHQVFLVYTQCSRHVTIIQRFARIARGYAPKCNE